MMEILERLWHSTSLPRGDIRRYSLYTLHRREGLHKLFDENCAEQFVLKQIRMLVQENPVLVPVSGSV